MKRFLKTLKVLPVFFLASCASASFRGIDFAPVGNLNPQEVIHDFSLKTPERFAVLESAVFTWGRREINVLTHTEVREADNAVAVAGFTPFGMSLMQVRSAGEQTEFSFDLPQAQGRMDERKAAEAVAGDIRRIYFDRVPAAGSTAHKAEDRIYYFRDEADGRTEWMFGGPQNRLIQKRYLSGGKEIWRVRYYGYELKGSYLYPDKMEYLNRERKYKVVLRLKEIFE